ncbi:MAG: response regulator [Caldilineaceae bacterium]|nr:response regulator [Caldilineaceae bacterium]
MKQPDALKRENEALRDRLSRLSRASLQINESLDFDAVLQSVLDSSCSLTGARCGVLTLLDESEYAGDFLSSGMTYEEAERIWDVPDALKLYEYLGDISEPFRHNDVTGYMRSLGLAEAHLPESLSSPVSFLAAPILHGGERVGNIFLGVKAVEREFTSEDEETLVMFACQAALVLANARRYRDEQRARDNLETLISTSPVGVVVFDARLGVALSLNQEARRIVSHLKMPGRSIEELLELITYRRADGREIALDEIPLARTLNTGETVRLEEIVMQVPDGRSVTALINATPIYSEKGEIDSVVVTMQDMTPLEEMERLRAQFMGMVSHEMRTPLTSIKGSVDTLLDDAASLDPAEMREFHRVISEQTDRMRSLINDLRDAARIETGTLSVAPEPSDVAVMVDEARSLFLSTGRRHGIRIEIAPELPQVMTDKRRIVQVLSNLFSNAARFSDEESMIKVSAAQEGFQVAVSVTDEGRGIPAERLPHLFRRSYRINNKDGHGDHEGSGLGLAICRGIVEAHGGRIWAESGGLGLGARFTFTLPVAEKEGSGESVETAFASERPEQPPVGRTPILAVDDDPHALRYIRSILSKADYDPIVTGNPEDVGRLIQEKKPHLVLLDLMLPGTDGIALMRDILAKDDLPVIFLSAYGQEDLIAKAFDMGAVDYVAKPFSPTELAARIRAALRRRSGGGLLMQSGSYRQGALTVNYAERRVLVAGRPIVLTATEYALLFELSTNAGRVMSHEQLLRQVWGEGHSSDAGLVRTIVKRLRQKLGDDAHSPQYIFTEPRVGYRMRKVELA